MKNINTDNEDSLNGDEEVTDSLIDNKGGHSLIKCNAQLIQSFNVLKSNVMGHKDRFYERVLSKTNVIVTQDSRSQSLPSSLDIKNKHNGNVSESCDTQLKLLSENESPPQSPSNDLWFKTWPERCDKLKGTDDENTQTKNCSNSPILYKNNENINTNNINHDAYANATLTLNEALQNISLAYSPITKQLHLISKPNESSEDNNKESEDVNDIKKSKPGHRRTEAGSFSSTISSLSDPSPSGSLLDNDERTFSSCEENGAKPKRKGISSFFTKISSASNWKLFGKGSSESLAAGSPQHQEYNDIVAGATALIQNIRPSNLPAKDSEEEQRHREEYKAMVAAAKKREAQNSAAKHRQQRLQLQQEEQLAAATKHFTQLVLPNWTNTYKTRKTRDLWWQGLPSSVRGKIWVFAIGNDLNLTQQLYEICLQRAQQRLNSPDPPAVTASSCDQQDIDQESSMDVIQLDIARTFPNLGIFQEGGPFSTVLHSLLAAYVCYRPDVGYVQGMSYLAAILILNMDQYEAFVCFANLLNRPLHLAAFTLNQTLMQAYYSAFNETFQYNLPKLFSHFRKSGLTPDLYLLDWVYTVFAKAMPLDVACRVWDLFLRDGDEFIFRTALGVLHLHQDVLLHMDFLQGAQFLTRLPEDLCADALFRSIQVVNMAVGKQTFSQIVERCRLNSYDN